MPAANKMMPTTKTMSRRRVFGSFIFRPAPSFCPGLALLAVQLPGLIRAKIFAAH